MEAIKMLEQYWEQLRRLGFYAQYCAGADIHTPVCLDFWAWSALATMAFGLLIIGFIAKRFAREQLEFYRAKKRLAARKVVASEGAMAEARQNSDAQGGELEQLSEDQLVDKIRAAIETRKKPVNLS
jgi:hypothetical protein